ncbi:MAG: hypothetical protein U0325_27170 [Polyangiales bacterium]
MPPLASALRLALLLTVGVGCLTLARPSTPDAGGCGAADAACCPIDAGAGCDDGFTCVGGVCRRCPVGQQVCDGRCVSTRSDDHCGACGARCEAGFACVAGAGDAGAPRCERVCSPGQTRCGSGEAAQCVSVTMDPRNCGACGARCDALPNVEGAACARGRCEVGTCAAGFANCDGVAGNGCEVDTLSTTSHCGRCGGACVARANSVALCRNGACDFTCLEGYGDCDGNAANGCEADLARDATNCSACSNVCVAPPSRLAVCVARSCAVNEVLCAQGTADCNGQGLDGCEVRTFVGERDGDRVLHCGACGVTCAFASAGAQCLAGTCVIGPCNAGFANCDGDARNGCETDLAANTTHCGRCGGFLQLPQRVALVPRGHLRPRLVQRPFRELQRRGDRRLRGRHPHQRAALRPVRRRVRPGGAVRGRALRAGLRDGLSRVRRPLRRPQHRQPELRRLRRRLQEAEQICSAGRCATTCGVGLTNCSGTCRDLATDRANCSACGRVCAAGRSATPGCAA